MSTQDLSPEQIKASEQIVKLLNLAAKAGTPEEAAAAAAKAQELLTKHNLDAAVLEDPTKVKREKAMVEGGSYAFERDLWRAVAELNFCYYWNQKYLTAERIMTDVWEHGVYVGRAPKRLTRRRHALVGRAVNVRATQVMATYLRGAIERVLSEQLERRLIPRQSNWAWSFRKGCAATIIEKLAERRQELAAAEEAQVRRMMEEAARTASSGISSATSLTVSAYAKSELEANHDFLFGEGWSARQAQERAARAARDAAMWKAYVIWCEQNPKLAQSRFVWKDPDTGKEYHYTRSRAGTTGNSTRDAGVDVAAYHHGREAGEGIGLDQQAEGAPDRTRITGSKDILL